MSKFIRAIRCPICDTVIQEDDMTIDCTLEDGVVELSMFSDLEVECPQCHAKIETVKYEDMIYW